MSRRDDGTEDFDTRCRMTDSCDCPECMDDPDDPVYDDGDDFGQRNDCEAEPWCECSDCRRYYDLGAPRGPA